MRLEAALLNMHICVQIQFKICTKMFLLDFKLHLGLPEVKFLNHILGRIFFYWYYKFVMYVLDLKIKYIFYPHWQHHFQKSPMGSIFESLFLLYYHVQRNVFYFKNTLYDRQFLVNKILYLMDRWMDGRSNGWLSNKRLLILGDPGSLR